MSQRYKLTAQRDVPIQTMIPSGRTIHDEIPAGTSVIAACIIASGDTPTFDFWWHDESWTLEMADLNDFEISDAEDE